MSAENRSAMSRAAIFGNIRRGLNASETDEKRRLNVESRLSAKQNNLIPKRAQLPFEEQVELFKSMATEAAAEVLELNSFDQVPHACADWLSRQEISQLISASNQELQALNWGSFDQLGIERVERVAQAGDIASLTCSFAGIAETGTLMLHSGSLSPTTLNFLPDNHLVILRRSDIVGVYEEAWKKVRTTFGDVMPRTINMITGPSRSADIEQKLQMGAHGPKKLVILLIND